MRYIFHFIIAVALTSCGVVITKVRYSQPYWGTQKLEDQITLITKDALIEVGAKNMYRIEGDKSILFSSYYSHKKSYVKGQQGGYVESVPMNRNSFIFELLITPRKELLFRPDGFVLKINGQKLEGEVYKSKVAAKKFKRRVNRSLEGLCDFKKRDSNGKVIWNHPDSFKLTEIFRVKKALLLQENTEYCFALKFGTPPPKPETHFSLLLGGVELGEFESNEFNFRPSEYDWVHN